MTLSNTEKAKRATAAAVAAKAPGKAPPAAAERPPGSVPRSPAVREVKDGPTGRTVVVVCKSPRGLFLQLTQPISQDQKVMGGGIEKRIIAMRIGSQVRLKPTVLPFGATPNYPIIAGFSLTVDVDADFWRQYAEQNKNFSMITSGLLKAFDNEADARSYCLEYASLRHGLEALAHKDDPRVEKAGHPNLTDIEQDTDSARTA